MMHSRRRDRSVIFRLSDEEYDSLVAAASRSRVRSVSEFIRAAVMSAIETGVPEGGPPGLHSPPGIRALERRIRDLEETLYRAQPSTSTRAKSTGAGA
jgi:Ribbon-helix-helix protein, copG family